MLSNFIILEGLDYTGKSSAIKELQKLINNDNFIFTREPGGAGVELAENIRNLILNNEMDAITEAYLFAASRSAHTNKIQEWLNKGKTVICDRYIYSSLYYQGILKDIGLDTIMDINTYALKDIIPKTIFYLTVSTEERNKRINNRSENNRLDEEIIKVSHDKATNDYMEAINKFKHKDTQVINIDTSNIEPQEIAKIIYKHLIIE